MADENKSEFRASTNEKMLEAVHRGERDRGGEDPNVLSGSERREDAKEAVSDRVVAVDDLTDEERRIIAHEEWLRQVDDTEIVDNGTSTTAYRRAFARFNPDENAVQLSEHYVYRSGDFERNGRF